MGVEEEHHGHQKWQWRESTKPKPPEGVKKRPTMGLELRRRAKNNHQHKSGPMDGQHVSQDP